MTVPHTNDAGFDQAADEAFRLLGEGFTRGRCCGRGAYGSVWLGRDTIGRAIAVKIVAKDPDGNWQREFEGISRYCLRMRQHHPNLLVIYSITQNEKFFCYAMEAADNASPASGGDDYEADTLARRLIKGAVPLEKVRDDGSRLIDALTCLHDAGLIHRDLKPDNIIFVNNQIKIADIGLVSSIRTDLDRAGTPGYIPEKNTPDSLQECVGGDLYALGKVLYCMMSGYAATSFPVMPPEVCAHPLFRAMNRIVLNACGAQQTRQYTSIREFNEAWRNLYRVPWHQRRLAGMPLPIVFVSVLPLVLMTTLAAIYFIKYTPADPSPPVATTRRLPPTEANYTIVLTSNFKKAEPNFWRITDPRDAFVYGRRGLRWIFRANGEDMFILDLKGFDLPDNALATLTLWHRGESGNYRVYFYDPDEFPEFPADYTSHRRQIPIVAGGQVGDGEKVITVRRRADHGPKRRMALVYLSTLIGDGTQTEELLVREATVAVPQNQE